MAHETPGQTLQSTGSREHARRRTTIHSVKKPKHGSAGPATAGQGRSGLDRFAPSAPNNAPASWSAVRSEAKSPLWLWLCERRGPPQATFVLVEPKSGDSADFVAAVQNLAGDSCVPMERASVLECGDERSEVTALARALTNLRPVRIHPRPALDPP
jgi:hypothetical protein